MNDEIYYPGVRGMKAKKKKKRKDILVWDGKTGLRSMEQAGRNESAVVARVLSQTP